MNGGIKIESDLDLFLDPKNSFNSPFKVGSDGKKIVLGRYTPTLDTIALLANTEKFKFENLVADVFQTKRPLEKAIHYHEFWGHVNLTKRSSFWNNLFMMNCYNYFAFLRMMWLVENGLAEEKKERIRKDLRDLILLDEMQRRLHELWRPLQETIANSYLIKVQNQTDDSELIKIIDSLVWKSDSVNTTINNLTKTCQSIMEELGYDKGWELLTSMSLIASSPHIALSKEKPKNQKDLKRIKKEEYERGYLIGKNDPYLDDPTGRFIEMILVVSRSIDITKKSLKRGLDTATFAANVALMCGHKIKILPDQTTLLSDRIKLISENMKVTPDAGRRSWHIEASKFMGFFKEIANQDYPISFFVNDTRSRRIYFANHPMLNKNEELWKYLHGNILKYQFLKSMEKGEDFLNCFDNRLAYCKSDCKKCGISGPLKVSKELYKVTSEYSYDELKREAMDTKKWQEIVNM